MRNIITNGAKSLNINSLPPEAWTIIRGGEGETDTSKMLATVAYYFACADTRIQAVGNMPYEIVRGDTVVSSSENDTAAPPGLEWLQDLAMLFPMIEAGKILQGKAYLMNERVAVGSRGPTRAVRWLHPLSIKPIITSEHGLTGFRRILKGRDDQMLEIEDIVYFWPSDPFVEIGPAMHYPGKAAMASANVLAEMDDFIAGYFQRGLVKATLLSYLERMSKDDALEVKNWWQRVTSGVKNAFSNVVVRGDFKATVIGEGLKDLSDKTLTESEKQNIAVAFRVPMSMVFEKPGGLSDGTNGDERAFIERVISPSCRQTAQCLNSQLLNPMGLHLRFLPEKLAVMQEDEERRSGALVNLTTAGLPLDIALETLGYSLDDDAMARITEIATAPPPLQLPPPQETNDEQLPVSPEKVFAGAALEAVANEKQSFRRWYNRRTNPDVKEFKSDLLSHGDKLALADELTPNTKASDTDLDRLIRKARSFFAGLYARQLERARHRLDNFGVEGIEEIFNDDERAAVARQAAPWFLDNMSEAVRRAFVELNSRGDFANVEGNINAIVDEMANTFAARMTRTSLEDTQAAVARHLSEGGTLQELQDTLRDIWEGPRPDFAAVTESTRLLARGRVEAFREAGASGYIVRTREDDRVREHHQFAADNGPWPLDDTEHLPPFDDVNCRCWIVASFD